MINQNNPEKIRRLQENLNRSLELSLPVDGVLGFRTRRAVRRFENKTGLPIDKLAQTQANPFQFALTENFSPVSPEIFGERNDEAFEQSACPSFTPAAVENPGGGRIKDKTVPPASDIVFIQGAFAKTPLHRLAARALEALVCAARADGIRHPQLLPTGGGSGFRNPKRQAEAWQRALIKYGSEEKARKWVAKPGSSAHQSGRAVDFYLGAANDSRNVARLRQTAAYKWMVANARRFGFYPYPAEPWHWEYNPPAPPQSEFFSPLSLNESDEYSSGFGDEYESFEDEDEFTRDEALNQEFEAALDVLSASELKAVRITSTFETGRAGGFGGLTGNFDGQGLSFGLLNFAFKAGSLPPLLQEFINKHPARYAAIFGKDAARFKDILFATKPDPKNPKRRVRDLERQMEFVNHQMNLIPREAKGNKIVEPWKTYFNRLENDSEFRKIQVRAVRKALDRARKWFDKFGFKTERGFAFMFDLVSSHGGAWLDAAKFKGKRVALLEKMMADKKARLQRAALTENEKMEVIANMIADVSLPKWRKNARTRKLWFVTGSGVVHGSFYDIRKNFGVTDNPPDFGQANASREFEWESFYDEREFELAQQSAAPAPALLGNPEKNSLGETFYVKIGIGKGVPASTGIFIPAYFKPDADFAVVVYLHGHKYNYPGNAKLIREYWNGAQFPFFALREEVAASGKNVIFVAPSLGAKSQAGNLIYKGGFDAYMKNVLAAVNNHYLTPRGLNPLSDIRNIILAAHSGGGSPMLRIAGGADRYAKKIKECWGFDSMYGAVAWAWTAWAKANPNRSFYAYYGPAQGKYDAATKKLLNTYPKDNALRIACEAKRLKLANLCMQPSAARATRGVDAHYWVMKAHLRERLLNSPCPPASVCPRYGR